MQQMSFRTQSFDDMPVIKCRGKKNRSKPDYPPTLPHPGRPVHLARDEAARAWTSPSSRSMDERRFILLIHERGDAPAAFRPPLRCCWWAAARRCLEGWALATAACLSQSGVLSSSTTGRSVSAMRQEGIGSTGATGQTKFSHAKFFFMFFLVWKHKHRCETKRHYDTPGKSHNNSPLPPARVVCAVSSFPWPQNIAIFYDLQSFFVYLTFGSRFRLGCLCKPVEASSSRRCPSRRPGGSLADLCSRWCQDPVGSGRGVVLLWFSRYGQEMVRDNVRRRLMGRIIS